MAIRCLRCRAVITDKSAFAAIVRFRSEKVIPEIVRFVNLKVNDPAIHLNGDRLCLREVTGFYDRVKSILGIFDKADLDPLRFV